MSRSVRCTTESATALWTTSALDTALFLGVFMVAVPWLADGLLPRRIPLPDVLRVGVGGTLVAGGLALWIACVGLFGRRGRGTPFPLDPPRFLVTTGPFAVVRNPIIAGEVAVVWGEALYLSSVGTLLYAVIFTLGGHCIVRWVEEPALRDRFGDEYATYCRRVPRWVPRMPWRTGAHRTEAGPRTERVRAGTAVRAGLTMLAVPQAIVGTRAVLAPRSCYDGFPLPPRTWMSAFGPYNEHLMRDLGMAAFALAVALAWAAVTLDRRLVTFSLTVWLVFAAPHLAYHLTTLDRFSPLENALGMGGLVLAVAIPLVLLVASAQNRGAFRGSPPIAPTPPSHIS